jgi:hypothetical protein
MIRFVKKAEPQPLPKEAEDKRPEKVSETAADGAKKSGTDGVRRRARQTADDDRLI